MMTKKIMVKKIILLNFFIALIFSLIEIFRIELFYDTSKFIGETLLFSLMTFGFYLFIFWGIALFLITVINFLPESLKNFFPERRTLLVLDAGIICLLLLAQVSSEKVLLKSGHPESSRNKTANLPNILFITIDTLRQDHLSSTGYKDISTPHIDYFSKKGITFTNAFCQIPVTTPSHSSILTGLNPYIHGSRNNGTPISKDKDTISSLLSKKGYKTAAFISSSTLKSNLSGLNKGFEYYDQFLCPRILDERIYLSMFGRIALKLKIYDAVERTAERANNAAISWLKKNYRKKFFMWMHYFDPHAPYVKHEGLSSAYLDENDRYNLKADYNLINSIYDKKFKPSPSELNYIISLYDGEIMYVDRKLDMLIKTLKRYGIFDNTLVILTADHGESLGEHDYYFYHGSKLYDPSMRIPLFFSGEYINNDKTIIESEVRSIDIAPSIWQLLDLKKENYFEGKSLFPLESLNFSPRYSYGENVNKFSFSRTMISKEDILNKKKSMRINGRKFIDNPANEKDEFYNIHNDPGEIFNIIDSTTDTDEFKKILRVIKEQYDDKLSTVGTMIDFKTLEELKTLGYVD